MFKLFKNFTKKDIAAIITCIALIVFQVWLDLRLPDYMSEITKLVQTEGSTILEILVQGGYMMACAFGSLLSSFVVGYIASKLSANFSYTLRGKVYNKVLSFGTEEIKNFQTSSLITRTTNDVTQLEMIIAMGLQMLIKAPIMAVWAVSKILNKSLEWSLLTGFFVVLLLVVISIIMIIVLPRFERVQKLIDNINNVTRESLTGIRVVRAFNAEDYQENRFGKVNEDLTKKGIKQAEELREKIKTIDYDIIICSPLIRAKHTAKIINVKEKEILIDNRLEERNPGSLSGQSLDVTNRDEYWNYYTEIQYGTSENIQEFFKRVYKFLDELKTNDYESVLIVAHSGVSKAFSGYFDGIQDGKFLNRGLKNCEIKEYEL